MLHPVRVMLSGDVFSQFCFDVRALGPSLLFLFFVGGENSLISFLVLYGLTRGGSASRVRASVRRDMLLRIGPNNWAEVVERSSLVMLFNLFDTCGWQD